MAVTAADARTVDQLVSVIRDDGQPKYLLFWGISRYPGAAWGRAA